MLRLLPKQKEKTVRLVVTDCKEMKRMECLREEAAPEGGAYSIPLYSHPLKRLTQFFLRR